MLLQGLLTALLAVGVGRFIEQQAAQVEGGGEPLLPLLGQAGLLAVVTFPLGGIRRGPGWGGPAELKEPDVGPVGQGEQAADGGAGSGARAGPGRRVVGGDRFTVVSRSGPHLAGGVPGEKAAAVGTEGHAEHPVGVPVEREQFCRRVGLEPGRPAAYCAATSPRFPVRWNAACTRSAGTSALSAMTHRTDFSGVPSSIPS
ncbi:hypothetical protein HRbin36_02524 [bacterium HR36]|nr:hypothetical protein HRbin36_02524 [bacterium HR36]